MNYCIDPKDFEIIDTFNNSEKLLFYTPNSQLFSINDENIINYLEHCKNHKSKLPDLQSNIEIYNLLNETFNKSLKPSNNNNDYKENIDTVILPISGNCNLRCSYCFASDNKNKFNFSSFNKDEAKNVIDYLLHKKNLKKLYITFFGGEPLLNIDVIKYTISYIKNNFDDRNVLFSITTNGTLLNTQILELIKKYNIPLLISFDGPKEFNSHRKFPNGKNSFDKILKNINILKENNIDINLRATITSDNLRIVEIYKFFESLDLPFKIVFAHNTINTKNSYSDFYDKLSALKKQFKYLTFFYLDLIKKGKKINCLSITDKLTELLYRNKKHFACSGGRSLFSITSDGNIYSCEHLAGIQKYSVGNIKTDIIKDKLRKIQSTNVNKIEYCRSCWLRYLCSGGCFADNIITTNNLIKPDDRKCELTKIEYKFIMVLYNEINKTFPDFFNLE